MKYSYLKVIQQNYGQGWEDVSEYPAKCNWQTTEMTPKPGFNGGLELLLTHDLREYRLTGYATRVIFRRVLNPQNT